MGFGQEDHKNAILITFVAYIPSAWLITVGVKSQPYHLVVISVLSGFPTEKLLFCFFMPFHSVVVGSHSAWPILQGSKAPLLEGAVSIDFLEFICTGDWSLSTNQILLPNGLRNLFFLSLTSLVLWVKDYGPEPVLYPKMRKSYNMRPHCTPWW